MTNDEVIALVCDPETRLVGATIFDALARVNINKDVGGAFVMSDDEVTFTQLRAAVQEVRAERDAAIARAERAEHDRDYLAGYQADLACIDKCLNDIDAPHDCEDGVSLAPRRIRLLGELVHTLRVRAEAAEALAASRLEAIEESESTLRGLLIGSHFYVQGGEGGDETFLRAEDARARAAKLLTIEREWADECVAWGVMIALGEEDAAGTAIEDADLDAVPALRAHAAKVSR